MKDGLYKVIGYDEKGKQICDWNNTNIGDEVYITKLDEAIECEMCGKKHKGYSISGEYEFVIGTTCIKHIKLEKVK
jgi:hypothetical protein